jgi:hypothetical protein
MEIDALVVYFLAGGIVFASVGLIGAAFLVLWQMFKDIR